MPPGISTAPPPQEVIRLAPVVAAWSGRSCRNPGAGVGDAEEKCSEREAHHRGGGRQAENRRPDGAVCQLSESLAKRFPAHRPGVITIACETACSQQLGSRLPVLGLPTPDQEPAARIK